MSGPIRAHFVNSFFQKEVIPMEKIFILDTNVLLEYPDIIPNGHEARLEEPTVDLTGAHLVIPYAVIQELAKFKKELDNARGRDSRLLLNRLRDIFEFENPNWDEDAAFALKTTVETQKGKLSILPIDNTLAKTHKFKPKETDMDGQIILTTLLAMDLQLGNKVILLTNDNDMAILASGLGVRTRRFKYRLPDPYTGRRDLTVPAELFESFIDFGIIHLEDWNKAMPSQPPLVANEFIVMQADSIYAEGLGPFDHIGCFKADLEAIIPLSLYKKLPIQPRTPGQAMYIEALCDPNIDTVIATGPAGTGKTFIATIYALEACRKGEFIGASIVPCHIKDDGVGTLPGYLDEKLDPNIKPLKNALRNYLLETDPTFSKKLKKIKKFGAVNKLPKEHQGDRADEQIVSIRKSLDDQVNLLWENWFGDPVPMAYAKGRDFSYELAIFDEFQDHNHVQADTLIKRIGEHGKAIITGDVWQVHTPYLTPENNGITYAADLLYGFPEVARISFLENEVERHPLVKKIAQRQQSRGKQR